MDIRLKILDDREKRLNIIAKKIKNTDNLLLTIKANICGNNKNIREANIVIEYFKNKVLKHFESISIEKIESFDGNFYLLELDEQEYLKVKKHLIEIESCELGRYVDLDLFKDGEKSISRRDLDIPARRCLVCGKDYNLCLREKSHSVEEVLEITKESIKKSFVDILISMTTQSLVEEVTAHPKFGLVTKLSSGKHKDMNYETFIDSIDVLQPFFVEYALEGYNFDEESFAKLREIGNRAEVCLLEKTQGVNTYKGIIFLLGILLPSIVDCVYNNKSFEDIQKNIKFLCRDILNDFNNIDQKSILTYGERIYLDYGITGIRGVAESGIEIAFDLEKKIELCDNRNDLVIDILLHTMTELDDTVILHKGSIEILNYLKRKSKEIIELGGYATDLGNDCVEKLTQECIMYNVSPGGSADIVTIVLILLKVRDEIF